MRKRSLAILVSWLLLLFLSGCDRGPSTSGASGSSADQSNVTIEIFLDLFDKAVVELQSQQSIETFETVCLYYFAVHPNASVGYQYCGDGGPETILLNGKGIDGETFRSLLAGYQKQLLDSPGPLTFRSLSAVAGMYRLGQALNEPSNNVIGRLRGATLQFVAMDVLKPYAQGAGLGETYSAIERIEDDLRVEMRRIAKEWKE